MSGHKVRLELPKFELEYSSELNDVLKKLGMNLAFKEYRYRYDYLFANLK